MYGGTFARSYSVSSIVRVEGLFLCAVDSWVVEQSEAPLERLFLYLGTSSPTSLQQIEDLPHPQQKRFIWHKRGFLQGPASRRKKQQIPKDIGPGSTFATQSSTAKRGVHSCENPLLKTLFSLFLIADFTSYGIKGGVRMPYFWVRMPYLL